MRNRAIGELIVCLVAAFLPTVGSGCVRASYVRERSNDIAQLSKEVRTDIERCSKVYEDLNEARVPVASFEPCQQALCGGASPTATATKCEGPPSPKQGPLGQAVEAANQARECAKISAQAAKEAQVAASTAERQAYERGRRSVLPCSGKCEESRRSCGHALSQIDRIIDAADALGRKSR